MAFENASQRELEIATQQAKEKLARIEKTSKVKHNDKYLQMLIEEQININRLSALTMM